MSSFDCSDGECDFEMTCTRRSNSCALPFDPSALEQVILTISDSFDFRVVMTDERTKGAVAVTAGLALAGGLIGRHFGGKVGAAVGGAIGGACGIGIVGKSTKLFNYILLTRFEILACHLGVLANVSKTSQNKTITSKVDVI